MPFQQCLTLALSKASPKFRWADSSHSYRYQMTRIQVISKSINKYLQCKISKDFHYLSGAVLFCVEML